MEYSGGYFLLVHNHEEQLFYLQILEQNKCIVDQLISIDGDISNFTPNMFKKPYRIFDEEVIMEKILAPNVFADLKGALEAYDLLQDQTIRKNVIGISLEDKHIPSFHEFREHDNDELLGEGVVLCLDKKVEPSAQGRVIGYDIAGYELGGEFLSFLGNHLLDEYLNYMQPLAINRYGLLSEKKEAEELADYTNDVLIEKVGAEELLWLPWKITLYK